MEANSSLPSDSCELLFNQYDPTWVIIKEIKANTIIYSAKDVVY